MSRAQELVDAHFDGYVGPLLTAAGVEEKVIALCAFMYKSSGIHFYKHCQEDAVEAARGAFANAAAHKTPSLCDSEVLDFSLPSITLAGSREDVLEKYAEEEKEWKDAVRGSTEELVEAWDCIQAKQTYVERGGCGCNISDFVVEAMKAYHHNKRPVMDAKAEMIYKNAMRGYYDPNVCEIIINSNGERWR